MTFPSVTFISGKKRYNSYTNWKLATDGTPVIALPKQKVQSVDIPGLNGVLDLSNSLRVGGGPVFQNREGSFTFLFLDMTYFNTNDWEWYIKERKRILQEIVKTVHGQMLDVFTTFDPENTYHGRFTVDYDDGNANQPKITIAYSLKPEPIG